MKQLDFRFNYAAPFVSPREMDALAPSVALAHRQLHEGSGLGSDFLGWLDLPRHYDREELAAVKEAAQRIQADSDVLIVIGIGGSYLGAKAALEMLTHSFYNLLGKK